MSDKDCFPTPFNLPLPPRGEEGVDGECEGRQSCSAARILKTLNISVPVGRSFKPDRPVVADCRKTSDMQRIGRIL